MPNPNKLPGDREHLKFNKDVLPEFKRRRDDFSPGGERAPAKRLAGRETDSMLKWIGVMIAVLGLAAAVGLYFKKQSSAQGDGDVQETAAAMAGAERERERELVQAGVTSYFAAEDLETRLRSVRRRDSVAMPMRKFYDEHGIFPVKIWNFSSVEPRSLDGIPFWHVEVETPDGKDSLYLENVDGDYLVDWESQVGLNPISVQECLVAAPVEKIEFRVMASPDDYYNDPFSDSSEFLSVKLEFSGDPTIVFGYVRRESPDFSRIFNLINGKTRIPLQLELEWGEAGTGRLPQVEIVRLVAGHWVKL